MKNLPSLFRSRALWLGLLALLFPLLIAAAPALAQSLSLDLGANNPDGGSFTGRILQLLALLTVLSLAPSILIMVTSFTRIVVVLSFLRSAIGLQQSPPNSVMVSLALFLTLFIMQPTFEAAFNQGIAPMLDEQIDEVEGFNRTVQPFREFMLAHTREADLKLFMNAGNIKDLKSPADTPLHVLIPAFMISELKRAFEIGFLLFMPFLIIDMVVASILMAMGMMMLPPMMIALPFKIIFFVLVDGWNLLSGSLIESYQLAGAPTP